MMNLKRLFLATAIAIIPLFFVHCTKERSIKEAGYLVPKTVDQDPSLPAITINGAKLHAEAFGHPDSSLLIILHGGPGSDYRYLLNCKAFADKGYRVVFYDQRGSGLSQRFPQKSYTSLQVLYDELSGVIAYYRKSPNQKVFLLGHSWGGILGTGYINQYPKAINGIIIGEAGGFKWADIKDYVSRLFFYKITSEATNDITYQDQFITGNENDHAILDYKFALSEAAEESSENPIGNEGKLPFWRFGAVINASLPKLGEETNIDLRDNLNQYDTKVLFLYSQNNRAYGLEYAQKVSSAYKNVQLFKVEGAGHDFLTFPTGWNNSFPVMLHYLKSIK
jgi:proline iminopeptidase